MPVFSRILPASASAYGLQTLLAAYFVPTQNDKYYDISGALGWLSTAFVSLYYPTLKARLWDGLPVPFPPLSTFPTRQLLLNAAVGIWALRLGSYLGARAIKDGGDSRFAEVKKDPKRFAGFWLGQGTWIFLVGLPIWLVNTMPPTISPSFGPRDCVGAALWAGSFLVEIIADRQKSQWRAARDRKEHDEKFITSGLWSVSRHPNYLGEVGLWTGVAVLASRSLQSAYFPTGTLALAAISPLLTWLLLTRVSGIPPLEAAGDKKFGNDPGWHEYKKRVPVFWPWSW